MMGYRQQFAYRWVLIALVTAGLAFNTLLQPLVWAQEGTLQTGMSLAHVVTTPNGHQRVNIEADEANVREVLRDLARQGGFNLILDDSVEGNISLELQEVSIDEAMSAISNLAAVEIIPRSENIYLAVSKEEANKKSLNRRLTKMIKVQFGNATQIAALINASLFAVENAQLMQIGGGSGSTGGGSGGFSGTGGGGGANGANSFQKIKADPRTNSLIIIGSQRDIDLAESAVAALDRPREVKTFYLNFANAVDVASQLLSSIFNDGTQGLLFTESGGGSGGGSGGAAGGTGTGMGSTGGMTSVQQGPLRLPSMMKVQLEKVAEGSGVNTLSTGGAASSFSQELVLRGMVKTTETIMVSPTGPIVIPDTRLNAVTVMGTVQQIQMAEDLIPILDAEPPQVAIEVSLVEINDVGVKQLQSRFGIADGRLQLGFNNEFLQGVHEPSGVTDGVDGTGLVGFPSNDPTDTGSFARSGGIYTSKKVVNQPDYLAEINTLINTRRAKILANPTVVAVHDTEAVISLVDQIIRRITISIDGQAGTSTVETEIGEAGIVLDILPKIGEDGTVSMRIRPSITSVRDVDTDTVTGNITTLLTKRDIVAQSVRLQDGETLVLGGLVQENSTNRQDKLPMLGDLPIVGALFRASQNSRSKTEIVMMITPHIVNKTKVTPVYYTVPLANR